MLQPRLITHKLRAHVSIIMWKIKNYVLVHVCAGKDRMQTEESSVAIQTDTRSRKCSSMTVDNNFN